MIAVGGANGLIDRFLMLMRWNATTDVNAQERKDALFWINWAQRFICNREALLFLQYTWSFTVLAAATKIDLSAAPFTTVPFDYSKDHTLFDGDGIPLEYAAVDQLHRGQSVADRVFTGPGSYIVSVDNTDSKRYIMFDEPQGSSNGTFKLHGQRHVTDATDNGAVYLLLPEGDEITLALPIAEQFAKQRKLTLDVSMLEPQTKADLEIFYGRHRSNKLTAATDNNRDRRLREQQAAHSVGEEK